MIHYVPICIILALLGTLLVNPTMYYHFFSRRLSYKKKLAEYEKAEVEAKVKCTYNRVVKPERSIFDEFPIWLIVGQIIAFLVSFGFCLFGFYSGTPMAIKYSAILAYMWVPAICQFFNAVIYFITDGEISFDGRISDSIYWTCLTLAGIFIVVSIGVGIHIGVYNYQHTYDDITFMEENHEEYPTVDEATLLQTANLAAGSELYSPVYRNGNWVYPVVNSSSNVASSGYLVVDAAEENISFVPKDISYSPWLSTANGVQRVARRYAPSAVFFGDVSFQIEPETGDIYFAQFYGDYACFRAGRKVEGVFLINASTGECISYLMEDIPDWVTGVSF